MMRKTIPVGNAVFKYENTIKPFFSKPSEYGGINKEKDMARTKRMQKVTTVLSCVFLAVPFLGLMLICLFRDNIAANTISSNAVVIIIALLIPLLIAAASMCLASKDVAKEDIDKMTKIDCILNLIHGEEDAVFKIVCEDSDWHLVKITDKGKEICEYSFVFLDGGIYIPGDKLEIDWDKMQARVLAR